MVFQGNVAAVPWREARGAEGGAFHARPEMAGRWSVYFHGQRFRELGVALLSGACFVRDCLHGQLGGSIFACIVKYSQRSWRMNRQVALSLNWCALSLPAEAESVDAMVV